MRGIVEGKKKSDEEAKKQQRNELTEKEDVSSEIGVSNHMSDGNFLEGLWF
jgi:hypothetical protein